MFSARNVETYGVIRNGRQYRGSRLFVDHRWVRFFESVNCYERKYWTNNTRCYAVVTVRTAYLNRVIIIVGQVCNNRVQQPAEYQFASRRYSASIVYSNGPFNWIICFYRMWQAVRHDFFFFFVFFSLRTIAVKIDFCPLLGGGKKN